MYTVYRCLQLKIQIYYKICQQKDMKSYYMVPQMNPTYRNIILLQMFNCSILCIANEFSLESPTKNLRSIRTNS